MALKKSMLSTFLVAVVALIFAGLNFFRIEPLESLDRALYDIGVKFTRAGKAGSVPVRGPPGGKVDRNFAVEKGC